MISCQGISDLETDHVRSRSGLIPLYVRGKSPVISVRALDRASPLVIGLTFSKSVSFSVANQAPTPAAFPEIADAKDHRTTSIEDKATGFQEQGELACSDETNKT